MCRRLALAVAVILICSHFAWAEAVDVTVSVIDPQGEKLDLKDGMYEVIIEVPYALSVAGQVKPEAINENDDKADGVFGWDVDLRVGDTNILELLRATMDPPRWTNRPADWTGNLSACCSVT